MTAPHNPPAFACASDGGHQEGMTLRDWFAGQALAWCVDQNYGNDWGKSGVKHLPHAAAKAYAIADAMLAARDA